MRVKNISILIQPKLHVVSLDFQKFFICVAFLLLTTFVPIIGNSSQRKEVVKEIPYRNLLLMAKDKQRVAYGDVMYEVTEEEFGMNFKKE